jgi:hypothetical protein
MTRAQRVTVAMPVYNGATTLRRAISSVLAQAFSDFELLIIDDGSSDDSVAIVESFQDPRIRLLVHDRNRGLAPVRNHLVAESRGDYIAWLDADDWAHPERLALQVEMLDKTPNAALCGTWAKLVTEDRQAVQVQLINAAMARGFTDAADMRATMPFRNTVRNSSLMLRAEVVRSNDLKYDETFAPAEDYQMWTQIIRFGDLIAIPKMLTRIYEYSSGVSSTGRDRQIAGAQRARLELLHNLGFNLDADETAAHAFVAEGVLTTAAAATEATPEDYSRGARWLDEIQVRNRRLLAFDPPALQRACAERFVALAWSCARACPGHLGDLAIHSRVSRHVPAWALKQAASSIPFNNPTANKP